MMNIIELSDVTKTFGSVVAVDNLSLKVPKGSIYGFIGPNGSGKTTSIRMIMKIMYPDNGTLLINGQEHNSQRLRNVGYLPEDRGLYKKMKLGELLQFHGELNEGKDLKKCKFLFLLLILVTRHDLRCSPIKIRLRFSVG